MKITQTELPGLLLIEPDVFRDERGYFCETYNQGKLSQLGFNQTFVQDNESMSSKGVLRGIHFQKPPFAQAKLVRAQQGKVLDVVVDIRKDSKTFGKYFSIELSDENKLSGLLYFSLKLNKLTLEEIEKTYAENYNTVLTLNKLDKIN